MSKYTPCPCCSKKFYAKCCKPYHEGKIPENAEVLMRSRYCAYAMGLTDYIMDTSHPDNPNYTEDKKAWKTEIAQFCKIAKFPGMKVIEFVDGDDTSFVTFNAFVTVGREDASFTEKSKFIKKDGRWLYLDGDIKTMAEQS